MVFSKQFDDKQFSFALSRSESGAIDKASQKSKAATTIQVKVGDILVGEVKEETKWRPWATRKITINGESVKVSRTALEKLVSKENVITKIVADTSLTNPEKLKKLGDFLGVRMPLLEENLGIPPLLVDSEEGLKAIVEKNQKQADRSLLLVRHPGFQDSLNKIKLRIGDVDLEESFGSYIQELYCDPNTVSREDKTSNQEFAELVLEGADQLPKEEALTLFEDLLAMSESKESRKEYFDAILAQVDKMGNRETKMEILSSLDKIAQTNDEQKLCRQKVMMRILTNPKLESEQGEDVSEEDVDKEDEKHHQMIAGEIRQYLGMAVAVPSLFEMLIKQDTGNAEEENLSLINNILTGMKLSDDIKLLWETFYHSLQNDLKQNQSKDTLMSVRSALIQLKNLEAKSRGNSIKNQREKAAPWVTVWMGIQGDTRTVQELEQLQKSIKADPKLRSKTFEKFLEEKIKEKSSPKETPMIQGLKSLKKACNNLKTGAGVMSPDEIRMRDLVTQLFFDSDKGSPIETTVQNIAQAMGFNILRQHVSVSQYQIANTVIPAIMESIKDLKNPEEVLQQLQDYQTKLRDSLSEK